MFGDALIFAQKLADQGLKGEVGLLLGGVSFSDASGLGNPYFADDAPDGGFAYGLRGGVLLGPPKAPKLGLELETRFAHPDLRHGATVSATAWSWRLLGRYFFAESAKIRPFASVGFGQEALFASKDYVEPSDLDLGITLGGGAAYKIAHRWRARVDVRWIMSGPRPDAGDSVTFGLSNNLEFHVGVSYIIGGPPPDEDDDGVYEDGSDKCPTEPEDRDGWQDDDGCPDNDNDGDGILDAFDKCPNEAEDKDGFEDNDGCPEPDNDDDGVLDLMDKCPGDAEDVDGFEDHDGCPDLDNDKDGIEDSKDACPNEPEDKDGFADDDGCPDPDNDGDGIVDANDKCPNEAEDFDGWQDTDGCPDIDDDGDGVPDTRDKCPRQPETFNGFEDSDGCPDSNSPEVMALLAGPIAGIVFTNDRIEPTASERALARILAILQQHVLLKVELRCPVGDKAAMGVIAQRTQARCGSVLDWLVAQKIAKSRLKAITETAPRGEPGVSVLKLARF